MIYSKTGLIIAANDCYIYDFLVQAVIRCCKPRACIYIFTKDNGTKNCKQKLSLQSLNVIYIHMLLRTLKLYNLS